MQIAEYPQRKCRITFTEDGLVDHSCEVVDGHPGPCAARSAPASVQRREAWEQANPGWEKQMRGADPFADMTIPEEQK